MKLKIEGGQFDLSKIELSGESLVVKKINDSIYNVRPLVANSELIIIVVDKNSYRVVDSLLVRSGEVPFSFSITKLNFRDVAHSYKDIFSQMKGLYCYSKNKECKDYAALWSVISYEIVLRRSDLTILRIKMVGGQLIPNVFKQNLIKEFQKEDIILAQNIILKNSVNEYIRIGSYGVYK
jgi:hypothetical protein